MKSGRRFQVVTRGSWLWLVSKVAALNDFVRLWAFNWSIVSSIDGREMLEMDMSQGSSISGAV